MSKNFIIAKAMLAGLGVYAVAVFLSQFTFAFSVDDPWLVSLNILIYLAAIFGFGWFLIFRNDWLARGVTGDYEGEQEFDRSAYLIKSFRISFVIIGLCLLCSGRMIEISLGLVRLFHLPGIRMWVQNLIETGDLDLSFSIAALNSFFAFLRLLLIAYLICGGRYMIRWHIREIKKQNAKVISVRSEE